MRGHGDAVHGALTKGEALEAESRERTLRHPPCLQPQVRQCAAYSEPDLQRIHR